MRVNCLQFYFPKGPPASKEVVDQCLNCIDQIFGNHPDGLPLSGGFQVLLIICGDLYYLEIFRYATSIILRFLGSKVDVTASLCSVYSHWVVFQVKASQSLKVSYLWGCPIQFSFCLVVWLQLLWQWQRRFVNFHRSSPAAYLRSLISTAQDMLQSQYYENFLDF